MDVVVAFLQAHIDKDVYVKPAPGHDPRDPKTGEVMVYKLERSLYGLAQSPVLWYVWSLGLWLRLSGLWGFVSA